MLSRAKCSRSSLTEYTTIVKTRLTDLSGTALEKNEVFASELIQQAIEKYCSCGCILSRVTEVSIFNSPFYIGCFLPLLLSPSGREDPARQALITELYR